MVPVKVFAFLYLMEQLISAANDDGRMSTISVETPPSISILGLSVLVCFQCLLLDFLALFLACTVLKLPYLYHPIQSIPKTQSSMQGKAKL